MRVSSINLLIFGVLVFFVRCGEELPKATDDDAAKTLTEIKTSKMNNVDERERSSIHIHILSLRTYMTLPDIMYMSYSLE